MAPFPHVFSAQIAAALLQFAGLVHLFWAMGGEAGRDAAIPSVDGVAVFQPSAGKTALVGLALFACAGLVLYISGTWGPPLPLAHYAGVSMALVFLARAIGDFHYVGLFKRVKGSPFAKKDTWYYTPLCFLLAGLIGRVSVG